jgi:hypothetical protein
MHWVTENVIESAQIVIVLTKNSKTILEHLYPRSIGKLHVIPHGVHPTPFSGTRPAKVKHNIEDSVVLSTFGLLSRGKGLEYVLKALPAVIEKHPNLLYLILGETHPVIRRKEGETYRHELSSLVNALQLENHVAFYDQYLSLTDLIGFLKATDIYVSTSINPHQAVSGTLSYALATGRAVVSTAFAQAKEIVSHDVGRLVPVKNSQAYSSALLELLAQPALLKKMHRKAYEVTRPMLWSRVASHYSRLLTRYVLPPLNLSHLKTMTDDVGLFQFATLAVPDKQFGYTLDDNARALVIVSRLNHPSLPVYLNFIGLCQKRDGSFINYIDHSGTTAAAQNQNEDLEDATSRAMWALSEVMGNGQISISLRNQANRMYVKGLPHACTFLHLRSAALLIKSLAKVITSNPEKQKELQLIIASKANMLLEALTQNSVKSWHWFDTYLGYNNAVVPEALLIAGQVTGNTRLTAGGLKSLHFLIGKTFSSNRYMPIGHSQWYINEETRSTFDQQPEDPASMIQALITAYELTHDKIYKNLSNTCFSWFLGNNSLHLPLYNYEDGGCHDGLHPDRVNLNQGAESLVSYLLSRLAVSTSVVA